MRGQPGRHNSAGGFTLIEVLMALTIFSLIAVLSYGALGIAGDGFRTLSAVRDTLELSGWTGRQLRSDVAYLAAPESVAPAQPPAAGATAQKAPLAISNDNRGNVEYDHLTLLVREPGQAGISEVYYYIDEEQGHLMRESRLLWARDSVEPLSWDMGEASSCSVEALAADGSWHQDWKSQGAFVWPRALRIRIKQGKDTIVEREWTLVLQYGVEL
ncbi:MAG: prepilin-type N-terminal cleavage/methylation domain-containing protein [Mariprofundus sp.]